MCPKNTHKSVGLSFPGDFDAARLEALRQQSSKQHSTIYCHLQRQQNLCITCNWYTVLSYAFLVFVVLAELLLLASVDPGRQNCG